MLSRSWSVASSCCAAGCRAPTLPWLVLVVVLALGATTALTPTNFVNPAYYPSPFNYATKIVGGGSAFRGIMWFPLGADGGAIYAFNRRMTSPPTGNHTIALFKFRPAFNASNALLPQTSFFPRVNASGFYNNASYGNISLVAEWVNVTLTYHPSQPVGDPYWYTFVLPSPIYLSPGNSISAPDRYFSGEIIYKNQVYSQLESPKASIFPTEYSGLFQSTRVRAPFGYIYTLVSTAPPPAPVYNMSQVMAIFDGGCNYCGDPVIVPMMGLPEIDGWCEVPPGATFRGLSAGSRARAGPGFMSCVGPAGSVVFGGTPNATLNVTCDFSLTLSELGYGYYSPPVSGCVCVQPEPAAEWTLLGATPQVWAHTCPLGYYDPAGVKALSCLIKPLRTPVAAYNDTITSCVPRPCPAVIPVPGLLFNGSGTYYYGDRVNVTCAVGYHRVNLTGPAMANGTGSLVSTCDPFGQWTQGMFTCQLTTCPPYTVPSSGARSCPSNLYNAVCSDNCTAGYSFIGNTTRTCLYNGEWSGVAAFCSNVFCGTCPPVTNGQPYAASFLESSRCTTTCNAGFTYFGDASPRVCTNSGYWSNVTFSCFVNCPALPLPQPPGAAGGLYTCRSAPGFDPLPEQSSYSNGTVCDYSCTDCYSFTSTAPVRSHTCNNGSFTGFPATPPPFPPSYACVLKDCGPYPPLSNGSVTTDATTCGGVTSVTCDYGNTVNGWNASVSAIAVCQTNSTWSQVVNCMPCAPTTYYSTAPTVPPSASPLLCLPCPEGGVCDGGAATPRAKPGWYRDPNGAFRSCVPAGACLGNNVCAKGFNPRDACSSCISSWTKDSAGLCKKCNAATLYFVIALVVALFAMGFLLFKLAKRATAYFASLSVGFNFLQIIAILSSFDLKWPSFVLTFLRLFQLFNFDIALFNPRCAVAGGGTSPFVAVFYARALLPFFSAVLFLGVLGLLWAYRLLCALLLPADSAEGTSIAELHKRDDDAAKAPVILGCLPSITGPSTRLTTWRMINAFISFLSLIYLLVTSATVSIFACTKQRDGRLTMDVEPAIECTSATYLSMRRVAVFVFVVFSCGLPFLTAGLLSAVRFDLWRYRTIALFGLLFQRYKPAFYFYESIIMLRRFFFVFGRIIFPKSPLAHAIVALLAVCASAVAQFLLHPYKSPSINHLELITMGFGITCVCFGIMYVSTAGSMSTGTRDGLGGLLVLLLCVSVLVIVFYVALEIYRQARLKSHGVGGGYASDRLAVHPAFFDLAVHIAKNKRVRDEHTTLYALCIRSAEAVDLTAELDISDEMVDTDGVPWYRLLLPTANKDLVRAGSKLGLVEGGARVVSAANGKVHYVTAMLREPAHYRLFIRAAPWHDTGAATTNSSVELSNFSMGANGGGLGGASAAAAGGAKPVLEMFLSSETGCSARQTLLATSPAAKAMNALVFEPGYATLRSGRSTDFCVSVVGASHVVVAPQKPVSTSSGFPLPFIEDDATAVDAHGAGRFAGVFKPRIPGQYGLWVNGGGASRFSTGSATDVNFELIATFDVAADDRIENRMSTAKRASADMGSLGSMSTLPPDADFDFGRRGSNDSDWRRGSDAGHRGSVGDATGMDSIGYGDGGIGAFDERRDSFAEIERRDSYASVGV